QCHDDGTCDPQTGSCSNPTKPDDSACDDNDLCTQTDRCRSGICSGENPVICEASDQCHEAGDCNPETGACSNPAKENGAACDDGRFCTELDGCQNGECVGSG